MTAPTAESVTRALGGKWHGSYGTARCPCHDDSRESLSITDGETTTLYKCFAGCASTDIAKEIGQKLNGHTKPNGGAHSSIDPGRVWQTATLDDTRNGKPLYTHPYLNPDGTTKFVVCRWEPKGQPKIIRPVAPVPGGWEWLGPSLTAALRAPRPLYRLAEAIAEPDCGILIVEGEKKADIAAKLFLGWTTVAWAGGKAGAALADWSKIPSDRRVCIWPDNDEPGRFAAAQIAAKIPGAAVVDPTGLGLPEKWDLGDPIPPGLDVEAIADAARPPVGTTEQASEGPGPLLNTPPPWDPPGETVRDQGPRFVLQPFNSIQAPMAPYYLVKGILPRRGLTVVWGPPKCGKSFWILDLALHVALGWEYRGRKVRPGPVVYIACEGGEQFGARIEAFRQEKMTEDLGFDVPFFLIAGSLDLIREHKRLSIEIAAVCPNPALVIIDTVNRSLDGSEVDDMPAYIKAADFLGATLASNIAVVHHCGINGERPRGHTSLTGNADAQIAVKKSESGLVTATVEFMKDGSADTEITSRIRKVDLGPDTDGDPRDSCVIDVAEDPVPEPVRKRVSGNQATALAILADSMPAGLAVDDWNERLRDAGVGKSRTATLVEIRLALKAKKLVHEYNERWFVTTR